MIKEEKKIVVNTVPHILRFSCRTTPGFHSAASKSPFYQGCIRFTIFLHKFTSRSLFLFITIIIGTCISSVQLRWVWRKKPSQKRCFSWKFSCSRTPASPDSHQGHWLEPGVFRWVSQVAAITWSHDPQTGLNRWIVRNWWSKTQTENLKLNQLNTGKTRKTRRKERQGRQIPKRLCAWKYLFINQKKNWQNEIRGCYIFCCCKEWSAAKRHVSSAITPFPRRLRLTGRK